MVGEQYFTHAPGLVVSIFRTVYSVLLISSSVAIKPEHPQNDSQPHRSIAIRK